MFDTPAALIALLAVVLLMTCVWALHLRDGDASIVDPVWGVAIWTVGVVHAIGSGQAIVGGRLIVLIVAAAWALRLGVHLLVRHQSVGEDRRYRSMREARGESWWWKSLPIVFLLQAALAWVVALPLIACGAGRIELGPLGWLGVVVALAGFVFEAIADGQLARFKHDGIRRPSAETSAETPLEDAAERAVFDGGLWRYSRHPNYFGESVFWWGLGLTAAAQSAPWALIGPALITFMLLKVSGVSMTEESIAERRPAYRDYVRRTNAFVPGLPKS